MDLARELSELGEHVEWPPTPELQPALEPRGSRRRRRRVVALGLAFAALVAVAAAFAVPSVARRDPPLLPPRRRDDRARRPPAAARRSARSRPASDQSSRWPRRKRGSRERCSCRRSTPFRPRISPGPAVSFLFSYRGEPVLLTEFAIGPGFMKKFAGSGTTVEGAGFDGSPGALHLGRRPRLLLPRHSRRGSQATSCSGSARGATYRLESRSLTKDEAVSLARSLTRG